MRNQKVKVHRYYVWQRSHALSLSLFPTRVCKRCMKFFFGLKEHENDTNAWKWKHELHSELVRWLRTDLRSFYCPWILEKFNDKAHGFYKSRKGRFVLKKLMLEEVQKQVEFLFLLHYKTNRRTESAPHLWCDVTAQCTFPPCFTLCVFFPGNYCLLLLLL